MRMIFAVSVALAGLAPEAARATDYLYTFTGVITSTNNYDPVDLYANVGDQIEFSLRVRDNLPTVSYSYGAVGSSAVGGPNFLPGTIFPVDRTIKIDPSLGYANDLTPLESGYQGTDNYSARVTKDAAGRELAIDSTFTSFTGPDPNCVDHCGGSTLGYFTTVQAYSSAFSSPDYRQVGSFNLEPGSTANLGAAIAAYQSAYDDYDLSLSHLTVTQVASAVPEPGAWAMAVLGLGTAGAVKRRRARSSQTARVRTH